MANKRLTSAQIRKLVEELDTRTPGALIAAANAEDRRRFDERCSQHPANIARAQGRL